MEDWTVALAQAGIRLDVFLAEAMGTSRAEAQRLLEGRSARLNGSPGRPSARLAPGDRVTAERPEPVPATAQPEAIPLRVAFEDEDLLVIDKPAGMVVHPAPGHQTGTLVNAVLAHADDLSGIGGEARPGIVHRLDRDTSGLLVVAKNDTAHIALQAQIQGKSAERRYLAVVWGVPSFRVATIDAPIGRHPVDRKRMAVVTDTRHRSREAVTELRVREPWRGFSLVEARLQTGRTHQIRVHCTYIGHPVVGDPTYGGERSVPHEGYSAPERARLVEAISGLDGQALHAYSLAFEHPRSGQRMEFTAEVPSAMSCLIGVLRAIEALT
jgi:23S rRNA pseudouridine1911/1915/1917 synthase